jgi:CO/xanthine dehydrogenase Mo-binding subunit
MKKLKYVGVGVKRVDALGKVTGETKYAGDLKLPGMCYGKILLSAYPRARVLRIDTRSAASIAGVKKIITAKDIPGKNRYGYYIPHRPALVGEGEETRYLGDPIALVVAENHTAACEAVELIKVDYEVLTPLTSPQEAMAKGAYQIHKEEAGNVASRHELIHGDIKAGFETAEIIVEQTYFTSRQEQAFLETEAGVAFIDDAGILHIYSCLQDPYDVVEDINLALEIPKSKIHVGGTPSGGAFGGKLNTTIQVQLAAMAYLAKVPVQLVLDREESFIFHPKRHPDEIRIKIGADPDGKIHALEAEVISDAGPDVVRTHEVLGLTVSALIGPYSIANVHLTGQGIYTNNLDSSAFRGFGAPQAAVAREGIVEKLARVLEMDSLVLRQKNFLKSGEETISPVLGHSPVSLDLLQERILEKMGPLPKSTPGANKRVGRAYGFDMPVFDVSAIPVLGKAGVGIALELFSDASAAVYAGGTELGQGSTTMLAQIAAEELGLQINKVYVEMSDTWTCPRAGRTSASRLTYVLGNALLLATDKIRNTLFERAAKILETAKDELILKDGAIKSKESSSKMVSLPEIADVCSNEGLKLREEGWFRYPEDRYMYGHTFMASASDVEVDLVTGDINILKLVNVHDAGKVINPVLARGQLFGGSMQALGYALTEDLIVQDGKLMTPSFAEYLIPTAMDVPEKFLADFVETPYPTGPYGAKGLAEHSLNTTTPAILNAICNAVNIDICTIPFKPERILDTIKTKIHSN